MSVSYPALLLLITATFRNIGTLSASANVATGSPFAFTSTGRPNTLVIVEVQGASAAISTTTIDIDGAAIIGWCKTASGNSNTGIAIGRSLNLAAGAHNLNVKISAAAQDVVNYILILEW